MNNILVIATLISFVATLILTVSTEEETPYLVIHTSNGPLLTSRIEVSHGQNLSLYCAVYPNHHSTLWQAKNKQIKSSDRNATLNIYNLHNSDLGSYNCVSPSAHIHQTVDLVKKRKKRQDSFEEILRKNKELIDLIIEENKNSQRLNNEWEKYERERAELEAEREKRTRGNRNIGIIVGALAFGFVIIVVLCVVCKRCHEKTPPPAIPSHQQPRNNNNTGQGLVNPYEISPLCRPIETSITPYPPPLSRPIETSIAPYPPERKTVIPSAPAADPPPPSYAEAVCGASSTVPHLPAQNDDKM